MSVTFETTLPAIPAGSVLQITAPDVPSSVVNVRDWGAMGDGASDDTIAIRDAIAEAGQLHKHLYIPEGTYAVCPQPGDVTGPGFSRAIFDLAGLAGVTIYGDGPGSILKGYFDGLTDPKTHWLNTGDSYIKIARFVMFRGGCRNVTFRNLAIDGGAGWTGDYTVGGNTQTGDGWDMGHKCFAFDATADWITIDDCTITNWRGEIVYAGGEAGKISLLNSAVDSSNASAVSCSADMLIQNSQIGPSVYNAAENQCGTGQRLIARGSTFAGKVNGIVYIGSADASCMIDRCIIEKCGHGLLLSNVGSNITVYDSVFRDCNNAVITSIMIPPPYGFRNGAFLNNEFTNCGSIIALQDPIDGLTVAGNTRDGQPWELN